METEDIFAFFEGQCSCGGAVTVTRNDGKVDDFTARMEGKCDACGAKFYVEQTADGDWVGCSTRID